jgi:uracil-DNA glycosylase
MLVGEAPGYKGARYTGIPFTSEHILLNHSYFGEKNGYRKTNELDKTEKENTAKIVWETLDSLDVTLVLWNAYPFHPFKNGNNKSNRAPRKDELKVGSKFLTDLIDMLEVENIIAVGKNAYKTICEIKIETKYIRHPSYGGKVEFIEGIKTIKSKVY